MNTTGPEMGHVPSRDRTDDLRIKRNTVHITRSPLIALLRCRFGFDAAPLMHRNAPESVGGGPEVGQREIARREVAA